MLEDVITKVGVSVPGTEHFELRAQKNTTCSIMLTSGNVTSNSRTESSGVGARVLKNGVCGFASESEYSRDASERVLKSALDNAEFMDRNAGKKKKTPSCSEQGQFDDKISYVPAPQKTYVDFSKALDCYIAEKYPNLASRRVIVKCDSMEKMLYTSDGYSFHTTLPRSYIYVVFEAKTNEGKPVSLFKVMGGFGAFESNFTAPELCYDAIDGLYDKIMRKREGVYAEAGVKTCVLGGALSGMLAHEAVGHTVEADLVLGGSVAAHNLGKIVASPLVSMTDFANTAYGEKTPLPVYVDDEGVVARDVKIIENGKLVGYMNNIETAAHFGMPALGNARAYSYSDEPLIRMRNTAILKGESTLSDIIASVDDGYYLTDTNNGQADTSGEFMFGVSMGYEIKNGKITRPILDTTISGIAFEMLKTVDMVGNTMEWESSGFCGKKQLMPVGLGGPAIRCKVTMGGR